MPSSKSRKKKERSKGPKEEEEGGGIPLKQMNEYRRSNRMQPLTKEQHEARQAVVRAKNQEAEEALRLKGIQTQLDQPDRSNIEVPSNMQSSSDAQTPQGESALSENRAKKIEEERKNLECAKNFQRIANMEHLAEKAEIESKRAEIENQTGKQPNLSIVSMHSLPLAGTIGVSNLDQTTSDLGVSNLNQTTSDLGVSNLNQTKSDQSEINLRDESANQTPTLSVAIIPSVMPTEAPERGQSTLNRQDVLDIAKNSQVKRNRPVNVVKSQWEDGHDELSDMLQGYTSPGGDTMRINRDLATLLIMSAAAEMPNRAALHAKQDAYDQVTLQAQVELGKQVAEYEEQRRRMAAEHEKCLEALRQENQRMIDEATRVRKEYTEAFMASKTPTVEEIETSQTRHHYQTLKEQMAKKEKRLMDENTREKNKRVQKEKELAEAEEQIEQLRRDLNFLEEALENGSKRAVPTRSPSDSPVSPDTKRTKIDEPINGFQASVQLGPIIPQDSKPVVSPFQDQTLQNQTQQSQIFQNHTPSIQTFQNQTQQDQSFQNQTQQTTGEGSAKENIQTPNTQNERPEPALITSLQAGEKDSDQAGEKDAIVKPGIKYLESAEKTRAAQASLIESFKEKRKEPPGERNENLYLDSDGDLVEMSSRSPSVQTGSPCHSDRSDRSSGNSSEGQTISKPIDEDGGAQREYRGRNRRIPAEEAYKTPRSGHYTDAEYDEQSLEAWRYQCRKAHDYMPDRDYSAEVHGKHLRILQAAIRDFKLEKKNLSLKGKSLLEFRHARYSHLQQQYNIPQKLRTGKELMDYSKKDPSVLRQYRCLPITRYYSMLLENTPGYEKNTSVIRARERKSDHNKGDQGLQSDQRSSIQGLQSDQSSIQGLQSDQRSSSQGLQSDQNKKILIKRGEQSYPPSHKVMQHRALQKQASGSAAKGNLKDSASNLTLIPSNVEHHDGDKWMERRAEHLARSRKVPIAGEEYESESGNERDDYNHSWFDDRMTPADKTQLAKWLYQIKRIKAHDYSSDYIKQRSEGLDVAQREYERRGSIPAYLNGVPPPWNEGVGLAITRFNEKIMDECNEEISNLRENNANRCALEDAEKKRKASGPGGQGCR
jgi:hypothetical protein